MSRIRHRAPLAVGLVLSLTGVVLAATTAATATSEPGSGAVDSTADSSGADETATESASGEWTNWRGDAGRTGVADAGPTGEPVGLWRVQAGGPCNPPPAVVSGVVYAPCDDGVLYALDAADGSERWRFEGSGLGEVTAVGPLVYVNDADVLRALDAATGQERWHAAVPGGTSAVVDDGILVIGTGDGFLVGLDAGTGVEQWRFEVSTHGAAHNPALADGVAYVGGDDAGFFAVDAANGTLLWRGDTGDDQTATAVVAEGVAYLGASSDSVTGHLYAFDATTGALLWKHDQALFSPAVLDGVGYSGGESGTVSAFDTADGSELWQTQLGGVIRNTAIAGGVVYALSDGNNAIYALDAATGDQLWSFPVDGGIDGGIAVHGGAAYVDTSFGGIYAIGGTEQGALPVTSPPGSSASVAATIVAATEATGASETSAVSEASGPAPASGPAVEEVWQSTGGADGLAFPAAMALDPQGQLWVADTGNHRFAILTPDGEFVETWGSPGEGDGEFNLQDSHGDPFGAVAFAPDGSFYVLDVGNYRVQRFGADRTFVASWGGFGQQPGTYTYPTGIAVDGAGTVYVVDYGRGVVEWYSPDGTVLGSFEVPEANGLGLDAAGNVYVSGFDPAQVDKFDPEGNHVATIGSPGSANGQFAGQPTSIAVDAEGRVYVSETPESGRVQVFDADGRFLANWGAEGQFPWAVVLDGHGSVYVDDLLANTVQKFRLLPPLADPPTGDSPTSVATSMG